MFARIYKPAKTAMQSGKANTARWVLEFEPDMARRVDPLMGWTSGDETTSGQVRIPFETEAEAVAYAERHGLPFRLEAPHQAAPQPKAYSDNFSFRRRKPWTH